MYLPPYLRDELKLAYACQVYYRWHTYRRRLLELRALTKEHLTSDHPEIHLLNLEASDVEIALLASIRPSESVASAGSKLKGTASKSLRELLGLAQPQKLLGGGYFACTTGAARSDELQRYLDDQRMHHGYGAQANPPVWLQAWPWTAADQTALQAASRPGIGKARSRNRRRKR
jgi:REP element-mobilizing transposase RayT